MLPLQRLEHPYLHELFKAVLLYDAPKVKKILAKKKGGKLLYEWELFKKYQEISPTPENERYKKNVDVMWILKHPEREELGVRRILHEVKTSSYNIDDVVGSYKNLHFYAFGEEKNGSWRDEYFTAYAGTTNTPIYVWGWKKYNAFKKYEHADVQKAIDRGEVRVLPLDWLLPILKERMSGIFK
jgi:hypothetical protein